MCNPKVIYLRYFSDRSMLLIGIKGRGGGGTENPGLAPKSKVRTEFYEICYVVTFRIFEKYRKTRVRESPPEIHRSTLFVFIYSQ